MDKVTQQTPAKSITQSFLEKKELTDEEFKKMLETQIKTAPRKRGSLCRLKTKELSNKKSEAGEKPLRVLETMLKRLRVQQPKKQWDRVNEEEDWNKQHALNIEFLGDCKNTNPDKQMQKHINHCAKPDIMEKIITDFENAVEKLQNHTKLMKKFEDGLEGELKDWYQKIFDKLKGDIDNTTRSFQVSGPITILYNVEQITRDTMLLMREEGLLKPNSITTEAVSVPAKYTSKYENFKDYYDAHEKKFRKGNYNEFAMELFEHLKDETERQTHTLLRSLNNLRLVSCQ
jgi:hypothetical protein